MGNSSIIYHHVAHTFRICPSYGTFLRHSAVQIWSQIKLNIWTSSVHVLSHFCFVSIEKAFCAGADIKEMEPKTYMDVYKEDMFTVADRIYNGIRKPIIAAVNGFALGGGCELAMTCDIIIAAEKAKFGQPEINLGTLPGIGGTQRLTRAVGKSKAMELCLTGAMFTAQQAKDWGLISDVVPKDQNVLDEAMKMANKITAKSRPIVAITKECVNRAYESSLKEGLLYERRAFHSTFSTKDQKEGMSAFREKREAKFTHQ